MYVYSDIVDIARQCSKVIALSYTPTRSAWGFWLLSLFCINCFFYFSHSDGYILISPCGLPCISPVSDEAKHLFYVFIGTFGYSFLWSTYSRHFSEKWDCLLFLFIYRNFLYILAQVLCQILSVATLIWWFVCLLS